MDRTQLDASSLVLHLTPGTSGVYADTDPDIGGAFATYAEFSSGTAV